MLPHPHMAKDRISTGLPDLPGQVRKQGGQEHEQQDRCNEVEHALDELRSWAGKVVPHREHEHFMAEEVRDLHAIERQPAQRRDDTHVRMAGADLLDQALVRNQVFRVERDGDLRSAKPLQRLVGVPVQRKDRHPAGVHIDKLGRRALARQCKERHHIEPHQRFAAKCRGSLDGILPRPQDHRRTLPEAALSNASFTATLISGMEGSAKSHATTNQEREKCQRVR